MKTQWPRSADEPGLYMAQTGNPGPPPFFCGGARLWRLVACVLACACLCLCPGAQLCCHVKPVGRDGLFSKEPATWG